FLQRLFAVRTKVQHATDIRPGSFARVGLEDFEIGKVLHRWPQGQIWRARQKSLDRPVLVWIEDQETRGQGSGVRGQESRVSGAGRVVRAERPHPSPPPPPPPPLATPPDPSPLLGIVVRHPDVLTLHAVGIGNVGRFWVTEPAAAAPLPEWLMRRAMQPSEAI